MTRFSGSPSRFATVLGLASLAVLTSSSIAFAAASPAAPSNPSAAAQAPAAPATPPAPGVVATVNGQNITKEQLADFLMKRFGASALDQIVDQTVLEQSAAKQGVTVTPADLETAFTAYRSTVPAAQLTEFDDYVKRVGKENILEQLRRSVIFKKIGEKLVKIDPAQLDEVHALHILIRPDTKPTDDAAAKAKADADALAKANEVLAEAKKPGADFGALAKKYSQDTGSAVRGGDLEYFGHGQMVPSFDAAAFSAKPGDIVGPVKSDFGYHIIKVIDHRSGSQLPAAERESKMSQLIQQQSGQAVKDWMDLQKKNAKIAKYPL